ncbi:MAG: hypothetical protein ABJB74_23320 [Gemmatimonas sp.]
MYATCLFCNASLGANEAVEHFPVGRRLAYDAAAGRLWVVCQSCERWNLSPLETRWEAIEEAERLFRGTRMRASTDNIGLTRLKEGTELVRIGQPLQTEFATWRYGDQFGKRYRKQLLFAAVPAAMAVGSLGFILGGPALGVGSSAIGVGVGGTLLFYVANTTSGVLNAWKVHRRISATVRDADGRLLRLTHANACEATLIPSGKTADWKLKVARNRVTKTGPISRLLGVGERTQYSDDRVYLSGDVALRALATILPDVNSSGASTKEVKNAVSLIENAANMQQLLHQASTSMRGYQKEFHMDGGESVLGYLPPSLRLALEMSLHSDDERRAMEGELRELEERWRDADAIAKIADQLLLPVTIEEQLLALREAGPSGEDKSLGNTRIQFEGGPPHEPG